MAAIDIPAAPLAYMRAGLSGPCAGLALDWYDDVREGCEAFSAAHGLPLERVAGVLAVTSPRVQVERNAVLAKRVLLDGVGAFDGLPSVRVSLRRYLDTGEIRGPKVGAFYRAILGDSAAVVVDTWVQRGLGHEGRMEGRRYKRAADAVRSLSGRCGVTPREGQAALWYGARAAAGWTGGVSRLRIDSV